MASQLEIRAQLALTLAQYLDEESSEYPVLHIDEVGRIVASYTNVDVLLEVQATAPALALASDTPCRRYLAPSATAAIGFITEVEAVRQCTNSPYLRIHTGLGPSSPGNDLCISRIANVCGGTTL